ncbi:MAG: PH domain-containing protein [Acidimicrobiia bacterium]
MILVGTRYRNEPLRYAGVGWILISPLLIALTVTAEGVTWSVAGLIGSFVGLSAAAAYQVCVLPELRLTKDGVLVVNPFTRYDLPASRIEEVRPSSPTLEVVLADATPVRVWAVQAANINTALGRRGHVDRVSEEVGAWVEGRPPAGDEAVRDPARTDLRFAGALVVAGALLGVILYLLLT